MRGRTSFVLIGCERSGQYRCRKKDFVRRDSGSRKCGCPFKLRGKPVARGQGWMVKLMCGSHNHELAKSLVAHPYVGRFTKNGKTIIADMIKSMVKPKNIMLMLKEHNANSYSTYKTIRYRLSLLDFVGVTPTRMTFTTGFAYLEDERVNNVVWALERFRGLFLKRDSLPGVIVTDKDLTLMNAVKTVFPECTNLLCRFHIDKNVMAKFTLYKRLLGIVSRYALNQIVAEYKRVHYAGKNPSGCGCVMRTTHGLSCACELSKYVLGTIPLDSIHMFWRRLSFSDQGLSEPQVTITEEMKTISKRFEELDVCGKVTLKSKLREIAYPDQNSMCPSPEKVNTNVKRSASSSNQAIPRRTMPMLDQFHPFIHDFIENIVDVKGDDNFRYRAIAALLDMGEDSWSLVCNHLLKELAKWSDEYINLFGGTWI
ncbi:hypothetical protein GmHk_17G049364 [Glycine max]|nr:hypothetical protein GmHk_17G049364 [Glycine max]